DKQYRIDKKDFYQYIQDSNTNIFESYKNVLNDLEDSFSFHDIHALCNTIHNHHFTRIALEYLPLSFSRRHGDPSRPWNRFSINTKKQDGSPNLDYQGNWRDIFQNWEALAHSFPLYLEGMIRKFVNASTCDGYNPYRVLKNGFDWEIVESHNPWSYIGYWGDHQIIYLLKLLELLHATQPHTLQSLLHSKECVYAHVPYKIKDYKDIILNPKHTVDFDDTLHEDIIHRMKCIGSDGALLRNAMDNIHYVDFIEKILTTILARLTNYIPEGGIWMNTQRPEWNDANNALVGNGISMVTLYYLHRCIVFISDILEKCTIETVSLSMEVNTLFESLANTVSNYEQQLHSMNDESRRSFMDELGQAGSNYRRSIYKHSFSGSKKEVSLQSIQQFLHCVLKHIGHTIDKNKRDDGLYHAYNILTLDNNSASIEYLPEMLEGQVAVISSGYLSIQDSLLILDSLRSSSLFREDQQSYMLYPLKQVPKFLEKNIIPTKSVESSALLIQLIKDGDISIIQKDIHGRYHFNGHLTNTREFQAALQKLDISYHALLNAERSELINVYESVFQHRRFTGRSGTFFAYEGIGSIYWHMVSKLRYAVQELQLQSIEQQKSEEVKKLIKRVTNNGRLGRMSSEEFKRWLKKQDLSPGQEALLRARRISAQFVTYKAEHSSLERSNRRVENELMTVNQLLAEKRSALEKQLAIFEQQKRGTSFDSGTTQFVSLINEDSRLHANINKISKQYEAAASCAPRCTQREINVAREKRAKLVWLENLTTRKQKTIGQLNAQITRLSQKQDKLSGKRDRLQGKL
ncbi:MAG: hypothetical protein ACO3YM_08310, partial [Candidatus Kapaibacteriota bacterium]